MKYFVELNIELRAECGKLYPIDERGMITADGVKFPADALASGTHSDSSLSFICSQLFSPSGKVDNTMIHVII